MWRRLLFLVILLLSPLVAGAHPLGMKILGQRMVVDIKRDGILVDYIAEIPTVDIADWIKIHMQTKGISNFSAEEEEDFNQKIINMLSSGIQISYNGVRYGLVGDRMSKERPVIGDPNFFEYRVRLFSNIPDSSEGQIYNVTISNKNLPNLTSVYLVGIRTGEGIELKDTNVPEIMDWSYDPSYREIKFTFAINEAVKKESLRGGFASPSKNREARLITLLKKDDKNLMFLISLLALALVMGAVHALGPGHGKALTCAYLAGSKGTTRHALILSGVVTFTHTAVVYLLGIFYLIFSKRFPIERFANWINLATGAFVLSIGVYALIQRSIGLARGVHHDYHADHHSDHYADHHGTGKIILFGMSVGILPCPTALALMGFAISINKILLGLVTVAAFSIGLAGTLTLIGILTIRSSRLIYKYERFETIGRFLPVVSAVVVTAIGGVIVFSALKAI